MQANLDALFALPSAAVTLESSDGAVSSGHAGVCWSPPAGREPADVQSEIEQILEISDRDSASDAGSASSGQGETDAGAGAAPPPASGAARSDLAQAEDSFGFRWLLLANPALDDLVSRVHLINSTLADNGWGPQLLCSVFGMVPGADAGTDAKPFFLIYLYKRGTFYPFCPTGKEQRDSEYELHLRASIGADLPVESDLSRWFPLWDLPVR